MGAIHNLPSAHLKKFIFVFGALKFKNVLEKAVNNVVK